VPQGKLDMEELKMMTRNTPAWVLAAVWLAALASTAWALIGIPVLGWNVMPLFAATLPVSIVLSIRRYGGKAALVFWVSAYVISNIFENISVMTGFPFGHYHYNFPSLLFHVPPFIGVIYASLGFVCWMVANIMLGEADTKLHRKINIVALPLVSGAIMTMWDVVTDPQASTFDKAWTWEQGGNFYGVPETNFLGWWLVTYVFFQVFAIYLARSKNPVRRESAPGVSLASILLYASFGMAVIVSAFVATNITATDPAGQEWQLAHVLGTLSIVTVFTVGFATMLALLRHFEDRASGADGK
jgi:uncharacterized membrane protein